MKLYEVQAAVFKVLDECFEAEGIKVGDSFDENTPFPYIFLGEINQSRLNTKATHGKEISQTVHVFSNFNGKEQAFEIVEKIERILNGELRIEGAYVIHNEVSRVRVFEAVRISETSAQSVEAQIVIEIQIEEEN